MRIKDNTVIITGADLSPGHEYEVMVQAVSSDGRIQSVEDSPRAVIVLKGRETVPSQPSGLTATGGIVKIALSWDVQTDTDFDVMEVWRSSTNNFGVATKVAEVKTTSWTDEIGSSGQTRYYWLIARNTSGKTSSRYPSTSGVSATTTGISPTNIDDFAVTATKMFSNTIILTADTWSNNTPVAGQITWNTHYLVYGGAYYQVTGSSTALRYVYWDVGHTAGAGTVADPYITTYGATATYTAAADRFVVVVNESGVVQKVWNASANMVIGSAFIMDAAIVEAKIDNLAVTQGKIGLLAVGTAQIDNLAVTNAKIASMEVAKLTAGTITGKTITLLPDMGGIGYDCYINSGKTDFSNVQNGFILGCDYSDSGKAKFYIGDTTTYLNWDGSALAIKGSVTITGGSGIASLTDAGDLATKDTVAATDCDATIISGGKIITGLLTATNIQTGTLTAVTVQTASSGQRAVLNQSTNVFEFFLAAGTKVVEINAGTYGYVIVGDQTGKELSYIKDGSIQLWSDTDSKQVITLMKDNGGWVTSGWINSDGDASLTDVEVNSLASTNNVTAGGYVRSTAAFKIGAAPGTAGIDKTFNFNDADANNHSIIISGGIITQWNVT